MEGVNKIVRGAQSSDRRVSSQSRERSWRRTALKIWNKLTEHEVFGRAAQLAYYWLFSIFPLLIFLTTLLAFLPMRRNLDQWIGAGHGKLSVAEQARLIASFQDLTGNIFALCSVSLILYAEIKYRRDSREKMLCYSLTVQ